MNIFNVEQMHSACCLNAALGCLRRSYQGLEGYVVSCPVYMLEDVVRYCNDIASSVEGDLDRFSNSVLYFCMSVREFSRGLLDMYLSGRIFLGRLGKYDRKFVGMCFSYLERISLAFVDSDNPIYTAYLADMSRMLLYSFVSSGSDFKAMCDFKIEKLSERFSSRILHNDMMVHCLRQLQSYGSSWGGRKYSDEGRLRMARENAV